MLRNTRLNIGGKGGKGQFAHVLQRLLVGGRLLEVEQHELTVLQERLDSWVEIGCHLDHDVQVSSLEVLKVIVVGRDDEVVVSFDGNPVQAKQLAHHRPRAAALGPDADTLAGQVCQILILARGIAPVENPDGFVGDAAKRIDLGRLLGRQRAALDERDLDLVSVIDQQFGILDRPCGFLNHEIHAMVTKIRGDGSCHHRVTVVGRTGGHGKMAGRKRLEVVERAGEDDHEHQHQQPLLDNEFPKRLQLVAQRLSQVLERIDMRVFRGHRKPL